MNFGAVDRDCALGDEFAGFFLGIGEAGFDQSVDKVSPLADDWQIFGKFGDIGFFKPKLSFPDVSAALSVRTMLGLW